MVSPFTIQTKTLAFAKWTYIFVFLFKLVMITFLQAIQTINIVTKIIQLVFDKENFLKYFFLINFIHVEMGFAFFKKLFRSNKFAMMTNEFFDFFIFFDRKIPYQIIKKPFIIFLRFFHQNFKIFFQIRIVCKD